MQALQKQRRAQAGGGGAVGMLCGLAMRLGTALASVTHSAMALGRPGAL